MSVSVALAVAAVVVGIGGALATLVAWGRQRRSVLREAAPISTQGRPTWEAVPVPARRHPTRGRRWAILVGAALGVIVTVIAIIVSVLPGGRQTPSPAPGSSVAPIAVLPDPGSSGVEDGAFSPDDQVLATADLNGSVYLWNVQTQRLVATLANPSSGGVDAVEFSPYGTMLAAGDRNGGTYLWQVSAGNSPFVLSKTFRCHGTSGVNALAFLPTGALATSSSGTVCVWAPTTGKVISRFSTVSGDVSSLAFSQDVRLLAAGTTDGAVALIDTATGEPTGILSTPSGKAISSVAVSADGKVLAVGDLSGQTELWNLADRRLLGTLADPASQGVSSVAFSPNGTTLATSDVNGKTYLWNLALRKVLAVLVDPHSEGVSAVTFGPDGFLIATADLNGRTYLWKYRSS